MNDQKAILRIKPRHSGNQDLPLFIPIYTVVVENIAVDTRKIIQRYDFIASLFEIVLSNGRDVVMILGLLAAPIMNGCNLLIA